MDGRFNRLANVAHMGRDIHPRNDPTRRMELDQRSALLREAYTSSAATDHRNSIERRGRPSKKNRVFAVCAAEAVSGLDLTVGSRCCTSSHVLGNASMNSLSIEATGTRAHQPSGAGRLGAERTRMAWQADEASRLVRLSLSFRW